MVCSRGGGWVIALFALLAVPSVSTAHLLSSQDEAYLVRLGPIRMCVDPDWMPFEKIGPDGQHVGMVSDYMELIRRRIDWPIVLVPSRTWTESLELARHRACDIVSALNENAERSDYLLFTRPYLASPQVLVARHDAPPIGGPASLGDRPLGISRNYAVAQQFVQDHPDLVVVEFDSVSEGLRKVARGEIFAFFGALFLVTDTIRQENLNSLRIAANTDYRSDLRIGVRKDEPRLLSILDRALAEIRTDEHIAIQRQWTTSSLDEPPDYTLVWQLGGVALALILGVVLWNRKLAVLNARLQREAALRSRTERRLNSTNSELNRSNRELEQFAYAVSHDLQEPLRMVVSYLELLDRRARDELDPEAREYLHFAVDGGKRMSALILGLLEYSRTSTRAVTMQPLTLADPLGEALSNLAMVIDERAAQIHVTPDLPSVIGDGNQLARVFQNILGNAIKYARPDTPPIVRIDAACENGVCTCAIADNGLGIDPRDFGRIFEIFQRIAPPEETDGIGMGLAVVKRIIERHKGRIWVDSTPGEGSVFRFTLPEAP